MSIRKVIVVGSGPAGLAASIYAARANLEPLCIEGFNAGGLIPGGQLMFTTEVENYPGFEAITGPELMGRMRGQAEKCGTEFLTQDVVKVDFSERPFKVWADREEPYLAETVIISTGARANYLGLESEQALKNKGVSACAVCDGAFFRDLDVAVVGGGDTAAEEATYLAGLCKSVKLIHRRDELRASKAMQQRVFDNPKIETIWDTVVEEVLGVDEDKVTGLRLKNVKTGDESKIAVEGFFVAIGHTPMTELFEGQLDMHENRYLKVTPGTTQTNVAGVYAAGDVQDWVYRQAITAAGTGCMAALEAERWLAEQ